LDTQPPILDCRGLSLGYGDEPTLRDVNVAVRRGEILAIIGGSGSGKSTLLKAMIGLLRPSAGTVHLFGRDLYAVQGSERRSLLQRIGVLFQQDALFGSLSLLENAALPLRELTTLPEEVALEVARFKLGLVGLTGLEDRRPGEVSGGQRKRAGLARACVRDPEIILCDEPSGGLDPVMAAQIDQLLLRFRRVLGITIVAVTHDLSSIHAIADRAVMLGAGRVCAEGTLAELERSREPMVRRFLQRSSPDVLREVM
jgi:phospholipid/cholesterol/gamma-HCH transport system ATP-binding protein